METGESSIGPGSHPPPAPPPGPPAPAFGTLDVTVMMEAICWDTFAAGDTSNSNDRPLQQATVRIRGREAVTNGNGLASIVEIPVGRTRYHVEKPATADEEGFVDSGGEIDIVAGPNPPLTVTLHRSNLGCHRKHTPPPNNAPTINSLPAMFWHDNVMIVIREIAWLIFLVAMIVFTVLAVINVAMSMHWSPVWAGFCLPVLCFGVVGYLTMILFGEIAGYLVLVPAGLSWLAMIGLTIAAGFGVPGMPPIDYVWFPPLCGLWAAFFVALPIRASFEIEHDIPKDLLFAIPSVVVGVVLFLVLIYVPEPNLLLDPGGVAGYLILCVVLCFIFGLLGGITGHAFGNDGKVEPYTARTRRMLLPYAGERYCVQGNRGWFSHYLSTGQERCYDFAVPLGTPVLAIEEGHVISWREGNVGSVFGGGGTNQANEVKVKHRDGTEAHYLHLKQNGVTEVGGAIPGNNNLHIHAGQIVGLAGSTGISRFPHIHLGVYESGNAVGIEFRDASVQRHGGRCFTFRAYLSDNPNNGPPTLPAAPPAPPPPPPAPPAPPVPPVAPAPPAPTT